MDAGCELKPLPGLIKVEVFDLALGKLLGKRTCEAGITEIQGVGRRYDPADLDLQCVPGPGAFDIDRTCNGMWTATRRLGLLLLRASRHLFDREIRSHLLVAVDQCFHDYRIPGADP
ncbi:hypothetical protein D9M70_412300 [compost metagenome]